MQLSVFSILTLTVHVVFSGVIQCPGGEYQCPDTATCCLLPDESYGCCPMVRAVCCADRLHCCPETTTCDTQHGRCMKGNGHSIPAKRHLIATRMIRYTQSDEQEEETNDITCADHKTKCPDDSTCCSLGKWHGYGCCPAPGAVCCPDNIHCCPHGMRCHVETGRCIASRRSIPWLSASQSKKEERKATADDDGTPEAIECNGGTKCTSSATCCQDGCCPHRSATCCNGYCCPKGYKCGDDKARCMEKPLAQRFMELLFDD